MNTLIAKALTREAGENRRNKTEERFWQMQQLRARVGEIRAAYWEPWKMRLADNTYYTPDCMVIENDGTLTIYEVKGYWQEDARVKIKVAAALHPYVRFVAVQHQKSQWIYEPIPA
jgi:hypothetical protein